MSGPSLTLARAFSWYNRCVSKELRRLDPIRLRCRGAPLTLQPGDPAPGDAQVVFDLVLSPDVIAYLQERLDAGEVDLLVTGLFSATQGGPQTYPRFQTQNGSLAGAGVLELEVQVVPEPGTSLLIVAGLAGLLAHARMRR